MPPSAAAGTGACSSNTFDAYDPTGAVLASVRRSAWGRSKSVTLADGRELRVEGRLFARDWTVTDPGGRVAIEAVAQGSSWSFHPDAFVVRCYDSTIGLAELVAIVELNRIMVKAARQSTSAG